MSIAAHAVLYSVEELRAMIIPAAILDDPARTYPVVYDNKTFYTILMVDPLPYEVFKPK